MARKTAKKASRKRANQTPTRRGGARLGSGRKPQEATKLRDQLVAAFEQKNVAFLARAFENLVTLANGGYQRVEEEWGPDPAPAVVIGASARPEAPADVVLLKRKVSVAEPDRAANQYLIDRALGKPKQSHEHGGRDGQPIPLAIEVAILKIYGADAGTG